MKSPIRNGGTMTELSKAEVVALVPCNNHWSKIGERCNVRIVACADRINEAKKVEGR